MNQADQELFNKTVLSLTNIKPDTAAIDNIEAVREGAKLMVGRIIEMAPASRERSLALTKLEESVMWAVKAIVLENAGTHPLLRSQ
jgi:hypothetical protein